MSEFDYTLEERTDRDITSKLYSSFFAVSDIAFVVAEVDTSKWNVNIQLVDLAGQPVLKSMVLEVYMSSDPDDIIPSGATSWAITAAGAGTLVLDTTAGEIATFQTDAEGKLDITLTETGALTSYMIAKLPNGELSVSDLITFVA